MKRFVIEQSEDEFYTSHSGTALIGLCLNRMMPLRQRLKKVAPPRKNAISHADVVSSYLGLLCLGKSDFTAIETYRQDPFFRQALGLKQVPSEPTLRQRLKARADAFRWVVDGCNALFL